MAVNFRIKTSHVGDDLHINLSGDFDGSSACELLNNLEDNSGNIRRIFIDTTGLKDVHPFGQAIFENQLPSAGKFDRKIMLIGKYAKKIAPAYIGDHL